MFNGKNICSSAAWMLSGQKAAGTARWHLQWPCAENCQLIAHKDDAQLISTLWFLTLKHQWAKIPRQLQEPQSIPGPVSGSGSIRSLGSRTLLPAAAGHGIFRGPFCPAVRWEDTLRWHKAGRSRKGGRMESPTELH